MSSNIQTNLLKKLLTRSHGRGRMWAALIALGLGTTLLLVSVLIWWNFNELLYGKGQNDSLGSTFLIIGKRVTEQNMAVKGSTVFTPADIEELKKAPQVEDAGIISGNHFPAYVMMGGQLSMATDLPLESVPDKFLDKLPEDWDWKPGSRSLPIIVSSQFLDLYNYVFAPSQGLPQLSEGSVKAVALNLKIGRGDHTETFLAHVVGFSDRIGSVLAPQSFIDYGNKTYGTPGLSEAPSQMILKARDPSDSKFVTYLEKKDYATNTQNLRWSRVRAIVEVVASSTGVLAILLMGLGTLVFVLFIELTIVRAQHSIALLLQVGYSPRYIGRFMSRRFVPMVIVTTLIAIAVTITAQIVASGIAKGKGLNLPQVPGYQVWVAAAISTAILMLLVTRSIAAALRKH